MMPPAEADEERDPSPAYDPDDDANPSLFDEGFFEEWEDDD